MLLNNLAQVSPFFIGFRCLLLHFFESNCLHLLGFNLLGFHLLYKSFQFILHSQDFLCCHSQLHSFWIDSCVFDCIHKSPVFGSFRTVSCGMVSAAAVQALNLCLERFDFLRTLIEFVTLFPAIFTPDLLQIVIVVSY
jgi:hypothetical protein